MTPETPTRHDMSGDPLDCRLCQYRQKRGPWVVIETPEPVTAPESYPAETSTRLAVSKTVGETTVLLEADKDGDLDLDPESATDLYGEILYGDDASDFAKVSAKVAEINSLTPDDVVYAVVEITTTKEIAPAKAPRPALPTTRGSVVRGSNLRASGTSEIRIFVLKSEDNWQATTGSAIYANEKYLDDVVVLFDAGATA